MTFDSTNPNSAPNPAFPLRVPGPRMNRSELAELFYHADLAGSLTPAETLPAPAESALSFGRNWKRMSGFGRWTPC